MCDEIVGLVDTDDSNNIDTIAIECRDWADHAFPNRTDSSMFLKLYGEVAELIEAGAECEDEIADILILVLDYAKRKGVHELGEVVAKKLNINRQRNWAATSIGTFQHVE